MDALPPSPSHYVDQIVMPSKAEAQLNALDPRSLGSLKSQSKSKDAEESAKASKSAAKQVESMFIQNMLKQFRQSSKPFESGVFSSSATESYRQMYDQQLSQDLANPGLGMAAYFERAINAKKPEKPSAGQTTISPAIEEKIPAESQEKKYLPIRAIGAQVRPKKQSAASEITLVMRALRDRSPENQEQIETVKVKAIPPVSGSPADPFLPTEQQEVDLGFYEPLNEVITSISIKNKDLEN